MRTVSHRVRGIIAALAIAFVAVLAMPHVALADYGISFVTIDATVGTDGTLTVVEERAFDFDDYYNGVYWEIPGGTYEGREIGIDVVSAERKRGESWQPMQQVEDARKGDDGVYLVRPGRVTEVKLFSPSDNEMAIFRITYRVTNGVSAWADCGELYWKFVTDGWDVPSNLVSCTIHLPVPAGETVVAGQNVRVWGHGPLDGDAQVTSDGGLFRVGRVGTSEFAEARIAFPAEWIPGVERSSRAKLDSIIAEETAWAEEANARRERARAIFGGTQAANIVIALGAGALALFYRMRYKRAHKAVFDEKYFRDVPTQDHPSMLGALYNGGDVRPKEFTAALMRLSDQDAVGLEIVRSGRDEDYRVTRNDRVADTLADPIDARTDDFLFRFLALRAAEDEGRRQETGFPPLMFKKIADVAKDHPSSYKSRHDSWESLVLNECEHRGFFREEGKLGNVAPIAIGVVAIVLAVILFFALLIMDAEFPILLLPALPVAAGVGLIIVGSSMKPFSPEAIEIRAQLEALRRWLLDFTRLGEAVPADVVLWNRLLVMAVVLDVADKVIAQLRMALPQMLSDPDFIPTYYWCIGHGSLGTPSKSFTNEYGAAAAVSVAELAESSSSSGGGGGGGFSGGGGGGFGGGGGGGAF